MVIGIVARGKLWDAREDSVIAAAAGAGLTAADCAAKLPGRTPASVRDRASKLKIRFGGSKRGRRPSGGAAVKARRDEARRVLGLPASDSQSPRRLNGSGSKPPSAPQTSRVADLASGSVLSPEERIRILSALVVEEDLPVVDRARLLAELRNLEKAAAPQPSTDDPALLGAVEIGRCNAAAAWFLARLHHGASVAARCRHCNGKTPLLIEDLVARALGDHEPAGDAAPTRDQLDHRRLAALDGLLTTALRLIRPAALAAAREADKRDAERASRERAEAVAAARKRSGLAPEDEAAARARIGLPPEDPVSPPPAPA